MPFRISKIVLTAAIALWLSLVAFGNITDYGSNLLFVQHVLAMDTIFPDARIHYRAIQSPWLQHAAYGLIIVVETLSALLCWIGSVRMWSARHMPTEAFRGAMRFAVIGLTLGVVLWLVGFMAIGGEWFGMWMSTEWNGLASASRFVVILLAALIHLGQADVEDRSRG